jgi:hypothetical protein
VKKIGKGRNKVPFPALNKKYNPKVRQEYIDQDYLDKLSPEEMTWMNKFMEEYNNAKFNNDETDLDQSPEGRKAAYDRNNARNRCLYSQLKVRRMNDKLLNYDDVLNVVEDQQGQDMAPTYMEDTYIEFMDYKALTAAMIEYDDAMASFTEAHE